MAQKRRASATTSRKCSTSYSMPGATLISSVPQTHRLHETKLDDLGSSSNFMLPSEPLECEICFCSYDPYDSANPALPLTCNHSTCFSCLFEYIKLKISNDHFLFMLIFSLKKGPCVLKFSSHSTPYVSPIYAMASKSCHWGLRKKSQKLPKIDQKTAIFDLLKRVSYMLQAAEPPYCVTNGPI